MEKNGQNIIMEQRLTQRLTQQQLRLVRMLDMSAPELDDEVDREMEANPALEAIDAESGLQEPEMQWSSYRSASRQNEDYSEMPMPDAAPTLYETLETQLGQLHLKPEVLVAARFIVGNLDGNGRLQRDTAYLVNDLAFSEGIDLPQSVMDEALETVRGLEPHGVGAISLADCLLLQLKYLPRTQERDDAVRILTEQYEAFSMLHTHLLVSRLKITKERVSAAMELIRPSTPSLEPPWSRRPRGATPSSRM